LGSWTRQLFVIFLKVPKIMAMPQKVNSNSLQDQ